MFDFIVEFMASGKYIGIFGLMALENIFPPIPSEMIMPLAGFTAARGELNLTGVLIAGTAGSVTGTLPWYYAGKLYGRERLKNLADRRGRLLTISPKEIDSVLLAFDKHGRKAVLLGRMAPAVRTLISVPAGIANMPLFPFLAYSTAGSFIWCSLLVAAGFVLEENYEKVSTYLDPVSKGVLALIIGGYLYRLAKYPKQKLKDH